VEYLRWRGGGIGDEPVVDGSVGEEAYRRVVTVVVLEWSRLSLIELEGRERKDIG
jgi:hypothetical protein